MDAGLLCAAAAHQGAADHRAANACAHRCKRHRCATQHVAQEHTCSSVNFSVALGAAAPVLMVAEAPAGAAARRAQWVSGG